MKSWRSSSKVIKELGLLGMGKSQAYKEKNKVLLCVFKYFTLCNICLKPYTSGVVCSFIWIYPLYT